MKRYRIDSAIWLGLIVLLCIDLKAGVNLKNGNFYISYIDVILPGNGTEDLEIRRTYNSKATGLGWFGFGWGCYFETKMEFEADGAITIREAGQGARTRFVPSDYTLEAAYRAGDEMTRRLRRDGFFPTKAAWSDLNAKLRNDGELRSVWANRQNRKNIRGQNIPVGKKYISNNRGTQKLERLPFGFRRIYGDGRTEVFDLEGKFVNIITDGYSIRLSYDQNDRISSISDGERRLDFVTNENGLVTEIKNGNDSVIFKYKNNDLIAATNVAEKSYTYDYDRFHNLTRVGYGDGSDIQMTYETKTHFISSFKNREGESIRYKYESNDANSNYHYWTLVTRELPNGKERVDRYEYEIDFAPNGSLYTKRILTIVNELKTETIYDPIFSLPLKIERGSHVTNFEYNGQGLLTKKTSTTGEYIELSYHPVFAKITKVVKKNGWTDFRYDERSNLVYAENNRGQKVEMIYNENSQISVMKDTQIDDDGVEKKRTLRFTYNDIGKPGIIALDGVGEINVEYNKYGEIGKVDSEAGTKMAIQVTQAFQSLLAIVKPAGVNLSL